MLACEEEIKEGCWEQFLHCAKQSSSSTAYENWLSPICVSALTNEEIVLEVPNIFVKEYLLTNYKKDLCAFLPVTTEGNPAIRFVIKAPEKKRKQTTVSQPTVKKELKEKPLSETKLNPNYRFDYFIEGPSNQFVKSAAMGVAARPGQSYNPLFIHGGVGLGKTHILHSIGHYIQEHHREKRIQCITTEAFINDLVHHLKSKSIEQMKRFYRSNIDVLIVDDIQFLENRLNFEEEFCHMFETLIHQNKQIVISSDKPPSQLKLSERIIARMEWGLVAHIGVPELETRVAILQHKAEQRGLDIPHKVAFFIAEHIYNNVRQLEGAVNRLSAQCRLLNLNITEEVVEETLKEMLMHRPRDKVSVEEVLKSVAKVFQVRVSEIKGSTRTKEIALSRQVAMYLAYKLINQSLQMIGSSFGKTHSTILHACKSIEKKAAADEHLRRQIGLAEKGIMS